MRLLDDSTYLYKYLFIGIFIGVLLTGSILIYIIYTDKLSPIQISLRGQLFTVTTCADPDTNVQFDLECPLDITLSDILEVKTTGDCNCDCDKTNESKTEVKQETREKQESTFEEIE